MDTINDAEVKRTLSGDCSFFAGENRNDGGFRAYVWEAFPNGERIILAGTFVVADTLEEASAETMRRARMIADARGKQRAVDGAWAAARGVVASRDLDALADAVKALKAATAPPETPHVWHRWRDASGDWFACPKCNTRYLRNAWHGEVEFSRVVCDIGDWVRESDVVPRCSGSAASTETVKQAWERSTGAP